MEFTQNMQKNRFLKLSLKKNRPVNKTENKSEKHNRSSTVIILDESYDSCRQELPKRIPSSTRKEYSPIVITDSDSTQNFDDEDLPNVNFIRNKRKKDLSLNLNHSLLNGDSLVTEHKNTKPSMDGWSPAQSIICTTPRNNIPSTPSDVANESIEECSIKKVQQSQKKLLNELYGETWKSIPTLFKTIKRNCNNFDSVTKKLHFNDDDDSDKENIRHHLKQNKELYLTGSDAKHKVKSFGDTEKKSRKKLYTEIVPNTPEPIKVKVKTTRNVNSTTKKLKGKSVTEMVEILVRNDIDALTDAVEKVAVTPTPEIKRLSFIGSLADNVPSWRCHPEALQYHDHYTTLRERLSRRLYNEFNEVVFDNALDADLPLIWDTKLRSTAGTTTNRLIKNSRGDRIRTSSIKLSAKVLDGPQRLRDTLIHELCHAATWLLDNELKAGHGPLWKKWARRAVQALPELGEIQRCHNMQIHFKYSYKCTQCGYSIQRHSKSLDVTKKCCGYCRGTFEIIVNKKNKDGVVVSTPARKGAVNEFAQFVKQNYGTVKNGTKTHAEVMKTLSEQFSVKKQMPNN